MAKKKKAVRSRAIKNSTLSESNFISTLKGIPAPIAIIIGALIIGLSYLITNQIKDAQIKNNCSNVLGSGNNADKAVSICYLNVKAGRSPFSG